MIKQYCSLKYLDKIHYIDNINIFIIEFSKIYNSKTRNLREFR